MDAEIMKHNTDISRMNSNTDKRTSGGMKTIGVTGLASLSFLFALSAMGEANSVFARALILGSLLLWAVLTWHIYQKD